MTLLSSVFLFRSFKSVVVVFSAPPSRVARAALRFQEALEGGSRGGDRQLVASCGERVESPAFELGEPHRAEAGMFLSRVCCPLAPSINEPR
jgi:hypothetical protein